MAGTPNSVIWYAGKEQDEARAKQATIEQDLKKISEALEAEKKHSETVELNTGIQAPEGSISFIAPEEEQEAKDFIEKEFLCGHRPRVTGYYMGVMVYEKDIFLNKANEKTALVLSDMSRKREKYINCVGRVVLQGLECYSGPRFEEHWAKHLLRRFFGRWMKPSKKQPWSKIGDWVVFPRSEGVLLNFKGKPLHVLPDDRVLMVIQNPTDVTRD